MNAQDMTAPKHITLLLVLDGKYYIMLKAGLVPKPLKSSGSLIPGTKPYFFYVSPNYDL